MSGVTLEGIEPWRTHGVLEATEIHVAHAVADLFDEVPADVVLAFALAVRAPRLGHLAVDLAQVTVELEGELEPSAAGAPSFPVDREAWVSRVAACGGVQRLDAVDAEANAPFVLHGSWLYTARYWNYQVRGAARLRTWADAPPRAPFDREVFTRGLDQLFRPPGSDRSEAQVAAKGPVNRQRLAAAMACTRRFTVITGGPGMGKTWTVRNVLALAHIDAVLARRDAGRDAGPLRVALAAPTGKAAARMREALRARLDSEFRPALEAWLSPVAEGAELGEGLVSWLLDLPAFTLHRLLGYRSDNPTRFRHDATNPLPFDVVVVDESSMVDFALMSKLFDAVGPQTRLILLGDRHQLASVEAGTVLSDVCGPVRPEAIRITAQGVRDLDFAPVLDLQTAEGVDPTAESPMYDAVVQFDRTFRFDAKSGIGRFAAACLATPFDAARAVAVLEGDGSDVDVVRPDDEGTLPERLERTIVEAYAPYLEALASPPTFEKLADEDARADAERRHHLHVLEAFDRFRILCAHRRGRLGVDGLNERVEVLLRRAGYLRERGRFFLGRPILVQRNDYAVRRYNGDIGVVVRPRYGPLRDQTVVAFPGPEGEVAYLATSRLPPHDTVFAMTIHKSQGSEYEHAMVVLPVAPSPICTRELVYTGVTRAKRRMTMVATTAVMSAALQRRVERASELEAAVWRPREN